MSIRIREEWAIEALERWAKANRCDVSVACNRAKLGTDFVHTLKTTNRSISDKVLLKAMQFVGRNFYEEVRKGSVPVPDISNVGSASAN